MSQERFAQAMHISVDLLRDWEEGRRKPRRGPAIVFLQIAARHPRVIHGLIRPVDESVAIVGRPRRPLRGRVQQGQRPKRFSRESVVPRIQLFG
jgi:transcriptional regulator with XRE-family HTH domain